MIAICAALVGTLQITQWRLALMVASVLGGLTGGSTVTLMGIFAYLADSCPPVDRTDKFPIVEATYAVGGFISYLSGGFLSTYYGETATLWVIVAILIVSALAGRTVICGHPPRQGPTVHPVQFWAKRLWYCDRCCRGAAGMACPPAHSKRPFPTVQLNIYPTA